MAETQKKAFDYFRAYESEQFSFYRIPKVLFTDPYFRELSTDAKVLYGLMLDRMSLSERNRWFDEEGRVYIIFTVEEVVAHMNCGRAKGMKILAEQHLYCSVYGCSGLSGVAEENAGSLGGAG